MVFCLIVNTIGFAKKRCGYFSSLSSPLSSSFVRKVYVYLWHLEQLFQTACSMVGWGAIFWQYSGVCSLVGLSHIGPLGHAGDRPATQLTTVKIGLLWLYRWFFTSPHWNLATWQLLMILYCHWKHCTGGWCHQLDGVPWKRGLKFISLHFFKQFMFIKCIMYNYFDIWKSEQ